MREGVGDNSDPIMRVTGLIQNGDLENANGRFYSTKDKPGFKLVFEKWRTHYKKKMRKSADTATKTM
jgi:hypothetical protein